MSVHAVVGALIADGMVLLGHRSEARASFPGVGDMPGGHVERGESSRAAHDRELREELGIAVRAVEGPEEIHLADTGVEGDLALDVWRVTAGDGMPENTAPEEHDELRWASG